MEILINQYGNLEGLFFLSMMPLIELKGAIPIGMGLGIDPMELFFITYIGSMMPPVFLIPIIGPLFALLRKNAQLKKVIHYFEEKAMEKGREIHHLGIFGLFFLVAIPLPGTGVWTGSLVAGLLGLRLKTALPIIALGNLCAGLLLFLFSHGVINMI